jgi:sensor domain CHASE-containing protein
VVAEVADQVLVLILAKLADLAAVLLLILVPITMSALLEQVGKETLAAEELVTEVP